MIYKNFVLNKMNCQYYSNIGTLNNIIVVKYFTILRLSVNVKFYWRKNWKVILYVDIPIYVSFNVLCNDFELKEVRKLWQYQL